MAASVSVTVGPRNSGATSEHFMKHAAERPDVGPLVDRQTARLLRAHIGGRPEDHPFPRPTQRDGG